MKTSALHDEGNVEFNVNPARPETGTIEEVVPGIRRLIAPNPGPFTFTGTCTYLIGTSDLVIVDPGPADDGQLARLMQAIGKAKVAGILVTHTHRDHSPLARVLKERTGATIFGCAPHRAARALRLGEINPLDASADTDHLPDRQLDHGEHLGLAGQAIEVIATPGHTANHLCFALPEQGILFSGDHVMGWSTSIVAPPDGAMGDYLASLEHLISREQDRLYLPGHGGPVSDPRRFTRGLLAHRRQRETQILDRLAEGPKTIRDLVALNYPGLAPALLGAAALSVFAHLEDLHARQTVTAEPDLALEALYRRR
ncbi:MAG: MBL fold metallo-hydrolase [Rhizobiales bacterium]|nr:MBL fold metallo-hydrolase [Hyphomicrobiales bacterium]